MIKKKTTLAYIGPTIRNVAVHGTVYADGIPDALARMKEKIPIITDLIIPGEKLAAAMREAKTPGTVFYLRARAVEKAIKEGVN